MAKWIENIQIDAGLMYSCYISIKQLNFAIYDTSKIVYNQRRTNKNNFS